MNQFNLQMVRSIEVGPPQVFDDPNGFVTVRMKVETDSGKVDFVFFGYTERELAPLLTQDEALVSRIRELEAENEALRLQVAQEFNDAG